MESNHSTHKQTKLYIIKAPRFTHFFLFLRSTFELLSVLGFLEFWLIELTKNIKSYTLPITDNLSSCL